MGHKPLTFAMAKTTELWPARQQRHLSAISEFTTDIQHEAGTDNPEADSLSWVQVNSVHLGVDYVATVMEQLKDAAVQALRTAATGIHLHLSCPFWSTF